MSILNLEKSLISSSQFQSLAIENTFGPSVESLNFADYKPHESRNPENFIQIGVCCKIAETNSRKSIMMKIIRIFSHNYQCYLKEQTLEINSIFTFRWRLPTLALSSTNRYCVIAEKDANFLNIHIVLLQSCLCI